MLSVKIMLSHPWSMDGMATWFHYARATSTTSGPDLPMCRQANLYFLAVFKHFPCLDCIVRKMEEEVSRPR